MNRVLSALGAMAAVLTLTVGCGDSSPPGAASGHYAGRGNDLGAVVDFRASDATIRRIEDALGRQRPRIVAAYLVNRSDQPLLVPTFRAERFDGRLVTMERADADRLVARIGIRSPLTVPANGATTVYLLTRERPEAVTRVVVVRRNGTRVMLTPEPVS